MKKRTNYKKLAYASDDWSFEYSYNDVKVKELVKWMNDEGRILERWEIRDKSKTMFIKERTLADILKKLVLSHKIQRLSHGLYACLNFKPTEICSEEEITNEIIELKTQKTQTQEIKLRIQKLQQQLNK